MMHKCKHNLRANQPHIQQQHQWLRSIKKLVPMISLLSGSEQNWVTPMLELVSRLLKHHGQQGTIKLLKEYRTFINRRTLSQHTSNLAFHKVDKSGFPRVLRPWKLLILGDCREKRLVQSLFKIVDTFRCKPILNLRTILDRYSGSYKTLDEFIKWLPTFTKNLKRDILPRSGRFILSNKAGPNGPATATSMMDLHLLRSEPNIYDRVKKRILFSHDLNLDAYRGDPSGKYHSKIVTLSDKACKTRIVAIADYWSNTVLAPVHDIFMSLLRSRRGDLTFRQSEIPRVIKTLGTSLYTSDITAFTDRLPSRLNAVMVEQICGDTFSEGDWFNIVCERTFTTRKGDVRYQTGNPMGLLSSWPVSTLVHHALKRFAAYKVGVKNYKYMILGDDSLDTNYNVYKMYHAVMLDLGMNLSTSKCTADEHGNAEFAKRLFTPEGEITGIPVDILKDLHRYPERLIELLKIMRARGYRDEELFPGMQALIKNWKNQILITLVLSAPEEILGTPPLSLKGEGDDTKEVIDFWSTSVASHKTALEQARKIVFWREVDRIAETLQKGSALHPVKGSRYHIEEDHPAIFGISLKLDSYLSNNDSYSIWKDWLDGKSYELAQVPTIETYRYSRTSQNETRCRFDVIKIVIAIKRGYYIDDPSIQRAPLSNFDLFSLAFPRDSVD